MKKLKKLARFRQSSKAGMSPGTAVFVGEQKLEKIRIDIIDYDEEDCREYTDVSTEECAKLVESSGITWINISGVHDPDAISKISNVFKLHPLTLEDIVNTTQRPKVEDFSEYIFIVLKMLNYNEDDHRVASEHVSLILGEGYVVSFQEDIGDVFDSVRKRIRSAKGRVRKMGADYLAYVLMDAVVDHYFLTVEKIGDTIEEIDDRILSDPRHGDLHDIHHLKRDILSLRKAAWPLREEIGALDKNESNLIKKETKVFMRDLYDHTVQVIDMVETFRDILTGLHDTYLSSISNHMNEVMKVLTIIATLFIPLTFITGVYGMNFEHMPELQWQYGYYAAWILMVAISLAMLLYFKKKKWL